MYPGSTTRRTAGVDPISGSIVGPGMVTTLWWDDHENWGDEHKNWWCWWFAFLMCIMWARVVFFCCWNMTFVDHDLMVMWWFHLLPRKWMCPWIRVLENFGKSCRFLEPKWPQHRKTIFYPVRFRGSGCTFAGSGGFGIVVSCWFLMVEKFQKRKKHLIWILRLAQLRWLDSVRLN